MRSDRERLVHLMRSLNHINGQYEQIRRKLGVKESLFVLLYACSNGEEHSQKDICDEWFIPRSTLNTTVIEQVKMGNVELVPRGDRHKTVRLTESGRAYAEQVLGPLLDAEELTAQRHVSESLISELEALGSGLEQAFSQLSCNPPTN